MAVVAGTMVAWAASKGGMVWVWMGKGTVVGLEARASTVS